MIQSPGSIDLSLAVVAAVLVGFPIAYIAKGLLPSSQRLWREGDHDAYSRFWVVTIALHWASVGVIALVLSRAGYGLDAVGLTLPSGPLLWGTVVFGVISVATYVLTVFPTDPVSVDDLDLEPHQTGQLPGSTHERALYLFSTVTAGFCEELVYRGFAIAALLGLGLPLWAAVLGATVSFVGVHGLANLNPAYAAYFGVFGLVFAGGYLLAGTLLPVMVLHGGYNALAVAVSTRRLSGERGEAALAQ